MENLVIRPACKEDAAALLAYVNATAGESDNLSFGLNEFEMTVEQEEAFLEKVQKTPDSTYLIGVADGEIICAGNLNAHVRKRFAHKCSIGMSVRKAYWGQGVGYALLRALIDFAKSTGTLELMHLEVRADNERAIALYKKAGFVETGRFPKDIKINGEYFDALFMVLHL